MVYDARHALEHPEVAGWALGSLDPDDVAAFEQHLQTCDQCRGEVAEFTPVAKSLALSAPAVNRLPTSSSKSWPPSSTPPWPKAPPPPPRFPNRLQR